MDILFHIIVWFINTITQSGKSSSTAGQSNAASIQSKAKRQPPSLSTYEQKTRDVWQAYRRKQEALEAQFRAKAPK